MTTPTLKAFGTWVHVATGTTTPAWPVHVAGDIALLIVHYGIGSSPSLTTPAGFSLITSANNVTEGLDIYWCRATSASMASPVTQNIGSRVMTRIITLQDCYPSGTPYEIVAAGTDGGGTSYSMAAGSPALPNSCVVGVLGYNSTSTAVAQVSTFSDASLSSLTKQDDQSFVSNGGVAIFSGVRAAVGSYGNIAGALLASFVKANITISFPEYVFKPGTGTLTLTGTVSILSPLTLNPGSLVLTGAAPIITAFNQPKPFSGTLALSGVAPLVGRTGTFPQGDPARLGDAPVFPRLGRIMPGKSGLLYSGYLGAINISGQQPVLIRGDVRVPSAGSLVIVGQAATVLRGFLSFYPRSARLANPKARLGAIQLAAREITNQTVTTDTGVLTLTGQLAVPSIGAMQPPTGALVLTGQTPVVTQSIIRIPTVGSLTLTGQQTRLDAGITPSKATLTLTGGQAVLDSRIVPTSGALVLTGFAPVQAAGLTVNKGTLTLTGQTPILDVRITPNGATLVLSGAAPIVIPGIVSVPSAGSLVLTGFAPVLIPGIVRVPVAGSLVLTGTTAVLDSRVVPLSGSLIFSGNVPQIVGVGSITPSTGALTLTGQAAVVTEQWSRVPTVGALVLTGQQVVVIQGAVRVPNAGVLALSGVASVVIQGIALVPNTGVLILTGQTPALDSRVVVSVGTLVLTGQQSVQAAQITTGTGSLVLTGRQAVLDSQAITSTGSLALTGQQARLDAGIIPPSGTLSLIGLQPVQAAQIATSVGSLVLAGKQAVLDSRIVTSTGTAVFTGQTLTATLSFGVTRTPGTGSLVFTSGGPAVVSRLTFPVGESVLRIPLRGVVLVISAAPVFRIPARTKALTMSIRGAMHRITGKSNTFILDSGKKWQTRV